MGVAASSSTREDAITQLKARNAGGGTTADFYNRSRELQELLEFFRREPSRILVMVGPRSCGKSALLKELERIWCEEYQLMVSSPMFRIDCRLESFGRIEDAGAVVAAKFGNYLDRLEDLSPTLSCASGSLDISHVVKVLREQVPQGSSLLQIMTKLKQYMSMHPATRPIFILDEANCLKQWPPQELKEFLGFFAAVTKQDHRAYLVLSSSDDFFISWAIKLLQDGDWVPFGVGPFSKEDARNFYNLYASFKKQRYVDDDWQAIVDSQATERGALSDEDWEKVFGICGGSPHLLRACAEDALTCSVDEALEGLVADGLGVVENGLCGEKWDGNKYRQIMKIIMEEGSIGYDKVVKVVYASEDEKQCKNEILAMLEENVIHVRYVRKGVEYADLPSLPPKHHHYQLMARSPLHLAAMKEVLLLSSRPVK